MSDDDTTAIYPHGIPPYRIDPHDPNAPGVVLWHEMPPAARAAGLYMALRCNMLLARVELRYNPQSRVVFAIDDHPADKTKKKIQAAEVPATAEESLGPISARFGIGLRREVERMIARRRR